MQLTTKKILYTNLALRIFLWIYAILTGHWHAGDTQHYTHFGAEVCSGLWGGEPNRVPGYLWYLCVLSPGIQHPATTSMIVVPLFLQTFFIWLCGYWIAKNTQFLGKIKNLILIAWLFDPVSLIYSHLVIADALFGPCILFLVFGTERFLNEAKSSPWFLGLAAALTMLMRPLGIPLVWFTFGFLLFVFFLKKRNKRNFSLGKWALAVLVCFTLVTPRLYWNWKEHGSASLALQGNSWLMSVAGVVENHGKGLDPLSAERAWFSEHHLNTAEAIKTLITHPLTWTWLTLKGVARVLVGHVNVEWATLYFGEAPLGPGWFGSGEGRSGLQTQGIGILFWVLGLLVTFSFAISVYTHLAVNVWRVRKHFKNDAFFWWSTTSIFFLTFSPQVYGDARFRLAVWPVIILLWIYTLKSVRALKNR